MRNITLKWKIYEMSIFFIKNKNVNIYINKHCNTFHNKHYNIFHILLLLKYFILSAHIAMPTKFFRINNKIENYN